MAAAQGTLQLLPATDRQQLMLDTHRSTHAIIGRMRQSMREEHATLIQARPRLYLEQQTLTVSNGRHCVAGRRTRCNKHEAPDRCFGMLHSTGHTTWPDSGCCLHQVGSWRATECHASAVEAGGPAGGDAGPVRTGDDCSVPVLRRRPVAAQVRC